MLFETLGQARTFLVMICCGAALAVLYDLMSAAKRRLGGRTRAACDVAYCVCCGALALTAMARAEQASLRGYVLLGLSVGWFLWESTIAHFARGIARKFREKQGKKAGGFG